MNEDWYNCTMVNEFREPEFIRLWGGSQLQSGEPEFILSSGDNLSK